VAAISTPMLVPSGLNACAKFSRRVAVASGQREQRDQERLVGEDLARGIEQERPEGGQAETGQQPDLVAESLIDQCRRYREEEVGAEVGQLDQAGLERAHLEDVLEAGDHGRGQVGGDSPGREAADDHHEEQPHLGEDEGRFRRRGPAQAGLVVRDCSSHDEYPHIRVRVSDRTVLGYRGATDTGCPATGWKRC
jgi:hypothetical protein